jgi:hypothetical protein
MPLRLAAFTTAGWLVSLASLIVAREVIRLAAVDIGNLAKIHAEATSIGGLPVFLFFAAANAAAIVWCIRAVTR